MPADDSNAKTACCLCQFCMTADIVPPATSRGRGDSKEPDSTQTCGLISRASHLPQNAAG